MKPLSAKAAKSGIILVPLLAVAGIVFLIYNAPRLSVEPEGIFQSEEKAFYCHEMKGAQVTVLGASQERESRRWKFKCSCDGRQIMLAMPTVASPTRPLKLLVGHTYSLDYYCADGFNVGGITKVNGEISRPIRVR